MKNILPTAVFILIILACAASSEDTSLTSLTPPRPDLDTLWEYRFFYDDELEAVGSSYVLHAVDDFQTGNATLKGFECWCFFGAGGSYYDFILTIYEDDNGHPGNPIWSALTNDVTFTDTGYQYPHSSDQILHCDILLDAQDYLYLSEYRIYWLEIYQEELTYFNWLCDPYYDGNLHLDEGDGFKDIHLNAFFVVKGNWGSSVTETSWGEIKAAYE